MHSMLGTICKTGDRTMAKAGREPAREETKDVTLQVRLTPSEAARFKRVADAQNRTVSNMLRTLVLDHSGRRAK